jgi:hypothetical protein
MAHGKLSKQQEEQEAVERLQTQSLVKDPTLPEQ